MVTPQRAGHHLDVFSMSRARRVVSRDAGQLVRALASLLGLAIAIALAVGLGSMMGGRDQRIPLAQEPVTSNEGSGSTDARSNPGDAFDDLFGSGGSTGSGSTDTTNPEGSEKPSTSKPNDPSDDVDLPDDDLPGPVEVPVTPLPDVDIEGVIEDLTGQAPPADEGVIGGLGDTVGGVIGGLGDTVGGLLGSDD